LSCEINELSEDAVQEQLLAKVDEDAVEVQDDRYSIPDLTPEILMLPQPLTGVKTPLANSRVAEEDAPQSSQTDGVESCTYTGSPETSLTAGGVDRAPLNLAKLAHGHVDDLSSYRSENSTARE